MIELFLPDYPADVEELLQEHVEEIHAEPEYYHLPEDWFSAPTPVVMSQEVPHA
jgi:hypothetical protein